MKTMLCAGVAAAALLVGSAAPSHAMLMLQIDNGTTIEDTGNTGSITFSSSVSGFSLNVVTGASTPQIGTPQLPELDLNSIDIASPNGGGTLTLALTDTDYVGGGAATQHFLDAVGGTLTGLGSSFTVNTYMDCTNTAFGQGTLLTSQTFSGSFFSGGQDAYAASCGGAYSLTQIASLTLPGGAMYSGDSNLAVPEPSTIALFGAGLIGLGFALRRKGRAMTMAA